MAHLKLMDKVLENTTGAPPTDETFGFALGVGNNFAGELFKKLATKQVPFLTAVVEALSRSSKLITKVGNVTTGAAVGTAVMEVAEAAKLVKDKLIGKDNFIVR